MAIRYLTGVNIDSNTLFVDSTNNRVGIGTASPSTILHLNSGNVAYRGQLTIQCGPSGDFAQITFYEGATAQTDLLAQIYAASSTNSLVIGAFKSDGTIIFQTNNEAERMRITSGGNVGIGTTSPSEKLHVYGNLKVDGQTFMTSGFSSYTTDGLFSASALWNGVITPSGVYRIRLGYLDQGGGQYWGRIGFVANTNWSLGTSQGGNSFSIGTGNGNNEFLIDNAGNVGIGTTSPTEKLELSGTGNVYARITATDASNAGVRFNASGAREYGIFSDGALRFYDFTAATERMRITSAGNVGIGTTSPTVTLEVSGRGLITSSGSSDTFAVTHSSGSGIGVNITKGGNGEGLYVNKTSGSGNAVTIVGTLNATTLVKSGGTSSQYLMADGSVSTLTNPVTGTGTTNYVPKWTSGSAIGNSQIFDNGTNVGIGTTSPVGLLNLNNGDAWINVVDTLRGLQFGFAGPSHGSYRAAVMGGAESYGGTDSGMLTFHTQNGYVVSAIPPERMRITSSGNVGIGTTSPGQKLTVDGTTAAYSAIGASDNVRTGLAQYDTTAQAVGVGGQLVLGYKYTDAGDFTEGAIIKMYKENGTSGAFGSGLKFQVRNNGANLSTKLILDPSGNLGVGTTSPSYKVDVSGDINFSSTLKFAGTTVLSNSGTDVYANIRVIRSQSTIADGMYINYDSDGGANADIRFFANGQNERMRIDASNGNVGIGTTSPFSRFTVSGALSASTSQISIVNTEGGHSIIRSGISGVSNNGMSFVTASVDGSGQTIPMVINASGNVGIGATIPGSRLQVTATSNSATTVDNGITILNDSGINNCLAGIRLSTYGDSDGGLYPKQFIGAIRDGDFGAGKGSIVFCNRDAVDTSVVALSDEKMRILPNGNVGIGTTNPASKLEVVGAAIVRDSPTTNDWGLRLQNTNTGGWGVSQFFNIYGYASSPASDFSALQIRADYPGYGRISFVVKEQAQSSALDSLVLRGNGQVYMNAGNVGIGTTSPTQLLSVAGNTDLGNSIGSVTSSTYTTRLSGYALYYDASNRYGNYGVLLLNADSGWTSSSRRFMITNGYSANKFAIIRSVDATTDPALGYGGSVTSGTVDFEINNAGAATFGSSVTATNFIGPGTGLTGTASALSVGGNAATATNVAWSGVSAGYRENYDLGFRPADNSDSYSGFRFGTPGGDANAGFFLIRGGADNGVYTQNGITLVADAGWLTLAQRSQSDKGIRFMTGVTSTTKMTILNGGNVGINITAPTAKLHVEGPSADGTPVFRVNGTTAPDSFNYAGSLMNSDLGSSRNTILLIGKAQSNRDSGYIGFNHSGTNGSNSNFLTFGLFQNDNIMNITGAGNVGIGTTTPSAKLHVAGASAYTTISDTSTSRYIDIGHWIPGNVQIEAGNADLYIKTQSSNYVAFGTTNSERLRITSAGNVGIGTTAPGAKLDIAATNSTLAISYGNTVPNNPLHTNYYGGYTGIGMDSATAGVRIVGDTNTLVMDAGYYTSGTPQHANWNSLLRVLTNGNVGINTTSPSYKLQVQADGAGLYVSAASVSPFTQDIAVFRYGGNGNAVKIENQGGKAAIQARLDNGTAMDLSLNASGGNVGIGTTSPASSLHVAGGNIMISNTVAAAAPVGGIVFKQTNSTGFDIAQIQGIAGATVVEGIITMSTKDPGGTMNERLRITSAGSVFINSTSMDGKLGINTATSVSYNPNAYNGTYANIRLTNGSAGVSRYTGIAFGGGGSTEAFIGSVQNANEWAEIVFQTFNGSAYGERARITSDGNVGIGTTTPSYKLDVVGDARITSGSLGVGVAPNATDGRIDASNDIVAYQTSDQRLKENVTPIENALDKVKALTGVEFDWIEEHKHIHGYEGHDTGIIAQQVQAVMPTAVRTNDSGYLSVRYEKMIALLIEGMKEQQKEIDELKKLIK